MARLLDDQYVTDLLTGRFCDLLRYIQRDPSLDLQIRENYINIYYRGGNIIKIEKKNSEYIHSFDENYFQENKSESRNELIGLSKNKDWDFFFPQAKQVMDKYLGPNRKEEREFQQLVVRDNNYSSIANGTDYFIIDIEYARNRARFDMVAVEWLSEGPKKKFPDKYPPKLVIIEMKYGDKAIKGKSGLKDHEKYYIELISNETHLCTFKEEMAALFEQKRKLGLIPCLAETENSNTIYEFADEVTLAFIIANHDPASTILADEIPSLERRDAKFIVSNFMGYGIYHQSVFGYTQFRQHFMRQIHEV